MDDSSPGPKAKRFGPRAILGALAALVIFSSVLGYVGMQALSGPVSLAVESVEPTPTRKPLVMNETHVREELPALAGVLDEAAANGTARLPPGDGTEDARLFLEESAYDQGVQQFLAAPMKGHVLWEGETYRIYYLRG